MRDIELRGMFSAHIILVLSIVFSTLVPSLFLDEFSVTGTHLLWLCVCSATVAAVTVVLYLLLETNPTSNKKNSPSSKVTKIFRSCLLFFISCVIFHGILVLYGAPLLVSFRETFMFAVLLSTFTTLRCLCMLGPNVQAWIRVFSKNGAMSIWDTSLQITTICSLFGAWLGAIPIPLDWDRPWQVWPISCTLGATLGFTISLVIAPLWIYWHKKHLTYKCR
ncbi:phosphatidylinositol-glycan biosynthesis class F protein isoform X1 [Hemiscyllium ocellatum]|uniref:phosphatidylinositol-glycan biosynthesis class F protein isoform X1 n=1 Tax=Hemiscyllium ocellatum TaxID=170820 RepID=UPI0029660FCE|nr:phosphatidylinositol-glycan biosynthesis class F protein isoform X1 [Hemiscyllium ocellatum]